MTDRRDRWVAAGALVVLVVLAATVAALVLDAQAAGIQSREELRVEQVVQLAASMDTRVQQIYSSLGAAHGTPGRWNVVPGDPDDSERLARSGQTTAGALLLDRTGTIVNGSPLRDPGAVGQRFQRVGLELVLSGQTTILGVGPGYTTPEPVIAAAVPVRDSAGALAGAYVVEVPVTPDSPFSEEVARLRAGDTGTFSFVDTAGRVVASSAEETLAGPADLPPAARRGGFHRAGGMAYASADVPSARWRLVFQQTVDEFEGDLTGPLRTALLLVVLVAVAAGGTSVVALQRRLRAAREEQHRLAEIATAREEFTSVVSHELRTPVAGLLGFLQTTLDHWEVMTDDERRRAVGRAQTNAERLEHLTTEVLDTTAVESGQARFHLELVDLRDVVTQSIETTRDANPGRAVELVATDQPITVEADPGRLRQVVTNVLDNAIKNSPLHAPVTVTVSGGDMAEVAVRDHGSGIAPEDRERVFEKYARGRTGLARGSGLGLYLAREIVSAHGGRIWVGDAEDDGATVVFTLPTRDGRGRP